MNFLFACRRVALAAGVVTTLTLVPTLARAQPEPLFGQQEVEQEDYIAVAFPFGDDQFKLLILEQRNDERACWSEVGPEGGPVTVEPLLLDFDFTGICGRSTDSNGYSIRMNNQDLGLEYSLRVVPQGGQLLLMGMPSRDSNAEPIVVGRALATSRDYHKIYLEPGWRFARRTYGDRVLGHVYLATDTPPSGTARLEEATSEPAIDVQPEPVTPPATPTTTPASAPTARDTTCFDTAGAGCPQLPPAPAELPPVPAVPPANF